MSISPSNNRERARMRPGPTTPAGLIAVAAVGALSSVIGLGGCYSHVVAEEGVGTGVDEVYEPNLKEPQEGGPTGKGWDDIQNPLP